MPDQALSLPAKNSSATTRWSGPLIANRMHPQIMRIGNLAGLLAGGVFVAEITLEYGLLQVFEYKKVDLSNYRTDTKPRRTDGPR